ncbi:hypothetical protein BVI2075_670018 [Burkholderia vietnamiensis]|nr:hypothetical protein BVI1335_300016 [Burkholderia vietnamiensis]CAG9217902.1 hypothetical protein BVI2075_670018 [Burkholderia vietnamiensis]
MRRNSELPKVFIRIILYRIAGKHFFGHWTWSHGICSTRRDCRRFRLRGRPTACGRRPPDAAVTLRWIGGRRAPTPSGQSSLCHPDIQCGSHAANTHSDICRGRGDFDQTLSVVAILDSPASGV